MLHLTTPLLLQKSFSPLINYILSLLVAWQTLFRPEYLVVLDGKFLIRRVYCWRPVNYRVGRKVP